MIYENMKPYEENKLFQQFGNLEGTLREGFKSINARLDKINGIIDNHETRINCNENKIDEATGTVKTIGIIWGIIVVAVSFVVSIFKR